MVPDRKTFQVTDSCLWGDSFYGIRGIDHHKQARIDPVAPFWRKNPNIILREVLKERTKSERPHLFGQLIPYNLVLRIFSEKPSGSNDGPYCPLHSCKKLGRSFEPFWRKGQKSKKTPFLGTSPMNRD